ncbi:MAG: hypothetical protein R2760_02720 [Chitinophagales bacterium]|nr:hypothetical protein [Bacteroidota bacterium]
MKKLNHQDIQLIKQAFEDFEQESTNDFKNISIYLWLKLEIKENIY